MYVHCAKAGMLGRYGDSSLNFERMLEEVAADYIL